MPILNPAADITELLEFLRRDPVLNSVPLGLLGEAEDPASRAGWFIATVKRDDAIVAAAYRTAGFPKMGLCGEADADALEELARLAYVAVPDVPSVVGRRHMVAPFTAEWSRLSGLATRPGMQERIHQLVRVRPQPAVPGTMRRAVEADRELLVEWMTSFGVDTGILEARQPEWARRDTDTHLARGSLFLWEDGPPVSLAGGRMTGTGVARIGPVYTPPGSRRRGYAGALVARVSQLMLDGGCHTCCLYTDASNATSNHVYAEVGYEPIAEIDDVWLRPG